MTSAPDVEATSNKEYPIVVGFDENTQIYDPNTDEWRDYIGLGEENRGWFSFGCLVRYRYKIYHVRTEVYELDTLYWTVINLGPIPEFLENPGRCAISTMDGEEGKENLSHNTWHAPCHSEPLGHINQFTIFLIDKTGILLRNGYWYRLSDTSWHQMKFPPHIMFGNLPDADALYNFRGKPTTFGAPTCDSDIICKYTEINQYHSNVNQWVKIGNLQQSRGFHEVVEIPPEFCQTIADPTTTTTVMQHTSTTAFPEYETAALIIGGVINREEGGDITDSVELFGCPNVNYDGLIDIKKFPVGVMLTGGIYYPDGDKVMVCGGQQCTSPRVCQISIDCYEWFPGRAEWVKAENGLNNVKWGHFMGLAANMNDPSRQVPMVLGYGVGTEIYNPDLELWEEYEPLEDPNWSTIYCLVQHLDSIWQMRSNIYELDLNTWNMTDFGQMPDRLINSGQCAVLEIDGTPGNEFQCILCPFYYQFIIYRNLVEKWLLVQHRGQSLGAATLSSLCNVFP